MKKKIAIIEDERSIANMYRYKLEEAGYEVQIALNGKVGLELVEKMKPDIILLDLMMPVMSGDEMLEKVRATAWGSQIKVIVLTNVSAGQLPKNLSYLSIGRYIIKAEYTPTQVATIVSEILDGKEAA